MAGAPSFDLAGRTALISGGYGDMAGAMASALAAHGCHVVLGARHVEQCQLLADEMSGVYGVRSRALYLDVTDEESVDSFVDRGAELTGRVDVLINSAATFWLAAPEDVPTESGWRRVIDVNLTGAFLLSRSAGRLMLRQEAGSIINVSSTGGLKSFLPAEGSTLSYTTSKGALINLTRDMAAQWAHRGVRVNALAPGLIDAGMFGEIEDGRRRRMAERIPMGRFGTADELGGAVVFLASDASSYVTGTVLSVDGGHSIV